MPREAKMLHGKRIMEAKLPMHLSVRENDVKNAKRGNPQLCVLARAAMHDKHVLSARIGKQYALIEFKSHFQRYRIDTVSKKMVQDFDETGIFIQGDYNLGPVPTYAKLTGVKHSKVSGKSGIHLKSRRTVRNIYRAAEVNAL